MVTTLIIGFIVFGMSLLLYFLYFKKLLYFLYFKKPNLPAKESARKNQDLLIQDESGVVTMVDPEGLLQLDPEASSPSDMHFTYEVPGTDYTRAPGEELPTPLPEEEELGPHPHTTTQLHPGTLEEALPHWPRTVEDLSRDELRALRKIRSRELLLRRAAASQVYTNLNVKRLSGAGVLWKQTGAPMGQVIAMGQSWTWPIDEFLDTISSADGKNLAIRYDDPLEVDPIMKEFWEMDRSKDGLWEVKDDGGLPLFGYRVEADGPSMRQLKARHTAGYYALVYDLKHDGTEYSYRGGKVIASAVRMDMKDGTPTTDPD